MTRSKAEPRPVKDVVKAATAMGIGVALAGIAFGAGCASLVAPLAVKFGSDLISSASSNYSQGYATKVQELLQGVYGKGAQRLPTTQTASGDPYASGAYPQATSAPSAGSPYPAQSDPYPQGGPYPAVAAGGQSPYPSAQSPYPSAQPAQDPYPQGAYGSSSAIVLDAAILAQRASDRAARRTDPTPLQDGETLRDGGNDPRKGDVIKFSFRVNCDCYVYVIGADATGYIARIFPDPASRLANPVRGNQQYVVPEGTAWYGLDQYKGVEQVFFIVSRTPRKDIEGPLTELAQTPRAAPPQNFRAVREAAMSSAAMRGLVKVQMGTPSAVQSESGQRFSFTPQAFAALGGADDVVVTRWFNHQ
jgi:uncharacterized protein DUF4384